MSKRAFWLVVLGVLTVAVLMVMVILTYLLFSLPAPPGPADSTPTRPGLSLPTAPPPTATPGPQLPVEILFEPEEPVNGYPNCDFYGFTGVVMAGSEEPLAGVQVVVWDDVSGLVALDTTGPDGAYRLAIKGKAAVRNLWVQIYENDLPVSEPVFVQTQVNCEHGFQIYQVNWRQVGPENKN